MSQPLTDDQLYNLPLYYDVAFSWDPTDELALLRRAFADHARRPVKALLEPACGSGRLLIALARAGYDLLGYDASPAMVDFARRRAAALGLDHRIEVIEADMAAATFDRQFDAAFNLIASLGHLRTEPAIVEHLRRTAAALRPGGLYIVQLTTFWDPESDYTFEPMQWTMQRDDVQVETCWTIDAENPAARETHHHIQMRITHGDRVLDHEERMTLRLWYGPEWRRMIDAAGLEYAGFYDEDGQLHPPDHPLTGDEGDAYHILRRPI